MRTTRGTAGTPSELEEIERLAMPIDDPGSHDPLLDRIGDARFVLLGEASHGTSEYYRWRAEITKRLIAEKGFSFVGVEGDWPDCYEINRWVKGRADDTDDPRPVLRRFDRWPTWMWANEEVADFLEWLRAHNRDTDGQVGFYGLDVYSLWESLERILGYLGEHEPDALEAAKRAYRCFEPYDEDPQQYAWATRMVPSSCEDEVVHLLVEMQRDASAVDGDPEAQLDALQNTEVLAGAERYYRTMVRADGASWNVRDTHMTDTLDRLMKHHGADAKAVVWEHNTHVGDARATDMRLAGMVNVGQLVRERHPADDVVLVGFGGHRGSVIAAEAWGAPTRRMEVPESPQGTHEHLLHRSAPDRSLLVFPDDRSSPWLSTRRGHRAIGVVYSTRGDRPGNWVPTVMGSRYDAFLFFEDTTALHPLDFEDPQPHAEKETYPWSV